MFSDSIKQERLKLGLTLKEASKRTGIQPSRLYDLENGINSTTGKPTGPTKSNIEQLARGYKLSEDFLLDLAGRPEIDPQTEEERRLVSHFKALSPGHRSAVLGLVDELFRLDQQA